MFTPYNEEKPSGLEIGDLLKVVGISKMRTGVKAKDNGWSTWYEPEILTLKKMV
jgi:hypothetical protein